MSPLLSHGTTHFKPLFLVMCAGNWDARNLIIEYQPIRSYHLNFKECLCMESILAFLPSAFAACVSSVRRNLNNPAHGAVAARWPMGGENGQIG